MDTLTLDLMDILLSPRGNRLLILLIVNSVQLLSFCWVQRLAESDWIWLAHLIWSCMISTGIQLQIFRSDNNCVHVVWEGHQRSSWLTLKCLALYVLLLPNYHIASGQVYCWRKTVSEKRRRNISLSYFIYWYHWKPPCSKKWRVNSVFFGGGSPVSPLSPDLF